VCKYKKFILFSYFYNDDKDGYFGCKFRVTLYIISSMTSMGDLEAVLYNDKYGSVWHSSAYCFGKGMFGKIALPTVYDREN